jgi:TPR repeat protein
MKFKLLAGVLFVFLSLGAAAAQDLATAMEAVHNQDYVSAYKIFKDLAEQGNAEAQYNLGILLRGGKGVTEDVSQAVQWFEKAANQGLPQAQYELGNAYEFGTGVKQSYPSAAKWYKKAAEHGNPSAQTNLAVLYANGQGVKQDIILAYVWSNLAASQGIAEALQNRQMVAEAMSPEMLKRVRDISRDFFQRYVAPYQSEESKRPGRRGAHGARPLPPREPPSNDS